MVTYHYVKFYVSIIIQLEVININVQNLKFPMSRIIFFVNVWRKNIFDIYVTEYGTALTTILPILFLYLNTVTVTARTFEP